MENNTQKICIFSREKYGNWEITETYSVAFRNFLISAFLKREKCRKMSEKYSYSDHLSLAVGFWYRESCSIFWPHQSISIFVFIPLFCHHPPICQRGAATSYFCYTVEIFLYRRRPAVPDARIRAPRHSGVAFAGE